LLEKLLYRVGAIRRPAGEELAEDGNADPGQAKIAVLESVDWRGSCSSSPRHDRAGCAVRDSLKDYVKAKSRTTGRDNWSVLRELIADPYGTTDFQRRSSPGTTPTSTWSRWDLQAWSW
jgi:hypothetical protein